MQQYKILWADDEIELLMPHIIFKSNLQTVAMM